MPPEDAELPSFVQSQLKRKREQKIAVRPARRPVKRKVLAPPDETNPATSSTVEQAEERETEPAASPTSSSFLSESSPEPSSASSSDAEDDSSDAESSSDEQDDQKPDDKNGDDEVINVLGRQKPSIRSQPAVVAAPLLQRLQSFLPALQAANEELGKGDPVSQSMEIGEEEGEHGGEEDKQYIEMVWPCILYIA